ncbi:MAG: glycosyltransferase family 1 protein [Gammaproteobacteria bacterium]|nr:glycosyltransferase family 1 protein [Gammaproteobacteria bacterium]
MRILIATDAWFPQVNGVVRTLSTTAGILGDLGHEVEVVAPQRFRTIPCPTYPEIRLALGAGHGVPRAIRAFDPGAIHIATEGPIGLAARRWCVRQGHPFTTSYHTRFPEYLRLRAPVPLAWSYRFMGWFHGRAARTMVATRSMEQELEAWGFRHLVRWTRGVDISLFRPRESPVLDLPRPLFMYVGRVAVEKNIEAFLALDLPGTKVVVGDGPALAELRRRHPDTHFTGYKMGEELAAHVGSADVMVFPSLTDTFGLVLLEAMASGVPVAAFPVPGPRDLVRDGVNGCVGEDLRAAALAALEVDRDACRGFAEGYSWEASTRQFLANLAPRVTAAV